MAMTYEYQFSDRFQLKLLYFSCLSFVTELHQNGTETMYLYLFATVKFYSNEENQIEAQHVFGFVSCLEKRASANEVKNRSSTLT